jgi:hypothetical protein
MKTLILQRVKVKESTVFSRKYCTELTNLSTLSVFEVDIWCYRGGDTIPRWILRQAGWSLFYPVLAPFRDHSLSPQMTSPPYAS